MLIRGGMIGGVFEALFWVPVNRRPSLVIDIGDCRAWGKAVCDDTSSHGGIGRSHLNSIVLKIRNSLRSRAEMRHRGSWGWKLVRGLFTTPSGHRCSGVDKDQGARLCHSAVVSLAPQKLEVMSVLELNLVLKLLRLLGKLQLNHTSSCSNLALQSLGEGLIVGGCGELEGLRGSWNKVYFWPKVLLLLFHTYEGRMACGNIWTLPYSSDSLTLSPSSNLRVLRWVGLRENVFLFCLVDNWWLTHVFHHLSIHTDSKACAEGRRVIILYRLLSAILDRSCEVFHSASIDLGRKILRTYPVATPT